MQYIVYRLDKLLLKGTKFVIMPCSCACTSMPMGGIQDLMLILEVPASADGQHGLSNPFDRSSPLSEQLRSTCMKGFWEADALGHACCSILL